MMTGTVMGTVLASPADAEDTSARHARGIETLKLIGGPSFDGPINNLVRISPDMARFTVEYPYGDVLSREGLDLRTRQICTVSSLIAQGSVQPQLRFHMEGLLNVGGEPGDLIELMVLSTAILGFPAAIDSIVIARQIFKDRGLDVSPSLAADGADRRTRGLKAFNEMMIGTPEAYVSALKGVSPELARWSIEFVFGDVLSRDGLEPKVKHLAIASMLATQGNRADCLRQHVHGALKNGAAPREIIEAFIQLSVYAGFPAALNALAVAQQAIDGFTDAPTTDAPTLSSGSEDDAVRRARGLATLKVTSGASGDAVIRSFDDVAPDIGRMIVDHSYGDIFHRPGLDPATRELTACAALAARGSKASQTPLRVHINAALNVGATRAQIVETLLNLLPYVGYPQVQDAMRIAGEEFARRGI
ncbi:MAG TPA: carboxymuconolactone decarboxylase family protein [Ancylobacter sp.]